MPTGPTTRLRPLLALALTLALLGLAAAGGCSGPNGSAKTGTNASSETTPGQFPAEKPAPAKLPAPPDLADPTKAVASYLDWTSYAYRILDSDVASMTFDPSEEVRVNSYVELNRQQGRAIDQRLLLFQLGGVASAGATATVAAKEQWAYRYVDTKTGTYSSPVLTASYDTTYTVVKNASGVWVVAKVDATSVGGPVQ
jgi:hypothetical protein